MTAAFQARQLGEPTGAVLAGRSALVVGFGAIGARTHALPRPLRVLSVLVAALMPLRRAAHDLVPRLHALGVRVSCVRQSPWTADDPVVVCTRGQLSPSVRASVGSEGLLVLCRRFWNRGGRRRVCTGCWCAAAAPAACTVCALTTALRLDGAAGVCGHCVPHVHAERFLARHGERRVLRRPKAGSAAGARTKPRAVTTSSRMRATPRVHAVQTATAARLFRSTLRAAGCSTTPPPKRRVRPRGSLHAARGWSQAAVLSGDRQQALETGRLGGLGTDVAWEEPWDPTDAVARRRHHGTARRGAARRDPPSGRAGGAGVASAHHYDAARGGRDGHQLQRDGATAALASAPAGRLVFTPCCACPRGGRLTSWLMRRCACGPASSRGRACASRLRRSVPAPSVAVVGDELGGDSHL